MAGRLAAFLDRAGRTEFVWGGFDCMLFMSDWCVEAGRQDPAAAYRGTYDGERSALRLITREGGLVKLTDAAMAGAGFERVNSAQAGDVGIVEAPTDGGVAPMGGVHTGAYWAVLAKGGLIMAPLNALRIWRV